VNAFPELIIDGESVTGQPHVVPICDYAQRRAVSPSSSVHEEQIYALVQQLFFRHESMVVRHVAFAAVDASTATASLCLEVANALAEEDKYDVGLIDTHSDPVILQKQLQIPSPDLPLTTWPIGPRLWMVPRLSWLADARGQRVTDQNLWRLRELTAQFDFSILWSAPVSWLTASVGQACDGLVLVLAANQTRRLVAAQIKRAVAQGTSPPARDSARETPFSCAARPLSKSVNLMGELATNRVWDTGSKDCPSQYARMIPGASAIANPSVSATPLRPWILRAEI